MSIFSRKSQVESKSLPEVSGSEPKSSIDKLAPQRKSEIESKSGQDVSGSGTKTKEKLARQSKDTSKIETESKSGQDSIGSGKKTKPPPKEPNEKKSATQSKIRKDERVLAEVKNIKAFFERKKEKKLEQSESLKETKKKELNENIESDPTLVAAKKKKEKTSKKDENQESSGATTDNVAGLTIVANIKEPGWTWRLVWAVFVTTVGSAIPVGYATRVATTNIEVMVNWCKESASKRYDWNLTRYEMILLWTTVVATFLAGGIIGSVLGGIFADKFGRKRSLNISTLLMLISALLFYSSKSANSIELILLGRLVIGCAAGIVTTVMPMYLSELAPKRLKGGCGVFCPLGISFGVVLAHIMSLPSIFGTRDKWPFLLSFHGTLIVLSALFSPWLVESPWYLFVIRGDKKSSLRELSKLRNRPQAAVADELSEKPKISWTATQIIKTHRQRTNLLLIIVLQAGQQLSGINAIIYYSTKVFVMSGLDEATSQYSSVSVSFLNFLMAPLMVAAINKFPRQQVVMISCSLTALCLGVIFVTTSMMKYYQWAAYCSIVALLFYAACFGFGLGIVPYFIATELFESGPRTVAIAIGSMANWLGHLVVTVTFLPLFESIGEYVFLLFAALCTALGFCAKFSLQETNPFFIPGAPSHNDYVT